MRILLQLRLPLRHQRGRALRFLLVKVSEFHVISVFTFNLLSEAPTSHEGVVQLNT